MARSPRGTRRAVDRRSDPDRELARRGGVADRYVLRVRQAADAAALLRVLGDLSIPLGYLLLLPAGAHGEHAAYLGLGAHDVADLPIRFASLGIEVERGEGLERVNRCDVASSDATPRGRASSPRPAPRPGVPTKKRRPA